MQHLPNEIIDYIFGMLPIRYHGIAAMVCQHWRLFARDRRLYLVTIVESLGLLEFALSLNPPENYMGVFAALRNNEEVTNRLYKEFPKCIPRYKRDALILNTEANFTTIAHCEKEFNDAFETLAISKIDFNISRIPREKYQRFSYIQAAITFDNVKMVKNAYKGGWSHFHISELITHNNSIEMIRYLNYSCRYYELKNVYEGAILANDLEKLRAALGNDDPWRCCNFCLTVARLNRLDIFDKLITKNKKTADRGLLWMAYNTDSVELFKYATRRDQRWQKRFRSAAHFCSINILKHLYGFGCRFDKESFHLLIRWKSVWEIEKKVLPIIEWMMQCDYNFGDHICRIIKCWKHGRLDEIVQWMDDHCTCGNKHVPMWLKDKRKNMIKCRRVTARKITYAQQ